MLKAFLPIKKPCLVYLPMFFSVGHQQPQFTNTEDPSPTLYKDRATLKFCNKILPPKTGGDFCFEFFGPSLPNTFSIRRCLDPSQVFGGPKTS